MPRTRTSRRVRPRKPRKPRKKRVSKRPFKRHQRMTGPFHNYISGDPFKPKMTVKLHYSETFTFTTGTLGVYGTQQSMLLNSLFDPNETGTGHQPYGFDQLTLLYRRYKVNAVLIELVFTDPSNDGMVVAAQLLPPFGLNTLTGAAIDSVKERPMAVTRSINNSGRQTVIIKQYVPMYALMGISELQFKAEMTDFSAGMGATPPQSGRIRFSAGSLRGTAGHTIICRCAITYYSTIYDRVVLAQS